MWVGWVGCGGLGLESSNGLGECPHKGGSGLFCCNWCGVGRKSCLNKRFDGGVNIDVLCLLWRQRAEGVWGAEAVVAGPEKAGRGQMNGDALPLEAWRGNDSVNCTGRLCMLGWEDSKGYWFGGARSARSGDLWRLFPCQLEGRGVVASPVLPQIEGQELNVVISNVINRGANSREM